MNNLTLLPFAGVVLGGYAGVEVYSYLCNRGILVPATPKCIAIAGLGVIAGFILGYIAMIKMEK